MTKELLNQTPITVTNGIAEYEYNVPGNKTPGTYQLYATYNENNHYQSSTNDTTFVVRIPTTITVENTTASYGGQAVFTAHVKHHTDQNVGEGQVQFALDGTNIGSLVNVGQDGTATLTINETPNTYEDGAEITASYMRGTTYEASTTSTPGILDIRDGTSVSLSSLSGNRDENITINATITSVGENNTVVNVNEGTAQLYIDNTVAGEPVSVTSGAVSFTYHIANNAIVGGHTIKVVYDGQGGAYDPSEGTATLTVRNPTTLTPVNVSGNKGATVPITVNVVDALGTPVPSGTVRITVGEETPVEATVGATGSATIQYTIDANETPGEIQFTAVFVEDDNYQGSTMATNGILTVRLVTGITVSSVDTVQGEQITLSSTVTDENENLVNEGTVNYELE